MKWLALVAVVAGMVGGLATQAVAAPGRMIFVGCSPMLQTPGLFLADPDGNEPVRLLWGAPPGQWGCLARPDWTSDGLRMVLSGPFEDGQCRLALMDACCTAPPLVWDRQLTVIDSCGTAAKWSPTDDRIAYQGESGLTVIYPDGGDRAVLVPGQVGWPSWSADGSSIVYVSGRGDGIGGDLWLVTGIDDPGGPAVTQLTDTPEAEETHPAVSPDGLELAYTVGPARPSDWTWQDPLPAAGIRVADFPTLTNERVLTDDPNYHDRVETWTPDGSYIYFTREDTGAIPRDLRLWRVKADGSAPAEPVPGLTDWTVSNGVRFLKNGVYITSRYTLPGYTDVPIDIGVVGAENLAGVQADIAFGGSCDLIGSVDSFTAGSMIGDWAVVGPVIDNDAHIARCLAYAPDPGTQKVSGMGELFNLTATMHMYEDMQLLGGTGVSCIWYRDFLLSDDWGEGIEMTMLTGAVALKPFTSLEVTGVPETVKADATNPEPFSVTITALGDEGELLPWVDNGVELFVEKPNQWGYPALFRDIITPSSAALAGGTWTGDVSILEPAPAPAKVVARYQDWGGKSSEFTSLAKGDVNGDGAISVFDVVKTANMAIDRGTWEDWQRWSGDLNGDGEVNIFDVVICAARAMEQMQSLSVGRGAATAVAPASSVVVTPLVSKTDTPTTLSVALSDCAGLAGIQVEVAYDASRLRLAGVAPGALLAGKSSWSVASNDKGGTVKAIAYSPTVDLLAGGQGAILTFTFDKLGKKNATPALTSVKLSAAGGVEIPSQLAEGRGKKK